MKTFSTIILCVIAAFAIYTRYQATYGGLPYLHHWDEPFIGTSALNIIKTGNINPVTTEICYGGFLRYTCAAIDYLHYLYLKTHPGNNVETLADVKTAPQADLRLLSHPSFYLWNRIFVALFSVLGMVVVFRIGKAYKNHLAGLLAALILGSSYLYFEHAHFITVDVPMAVWVVITAWLALSFHRSKRLTFLSLSLAAGGFALATKLSGGMALIIPFTAFLLNLKLLLRGTVTTTALLLLFWAVLPFAVFLAWNPNVITDTANYVYWNTWIMEVYKTGAGHFSKEPGWEHFSFQLFSIRDDLSGFVFWAALLGPVLSCISIQYEAGGRKLAFRPNAATLIVFVFPVVYIAYMTRQRVAYPRNFIVMYPFFSLAAGYAVSHTVDIVRALLSVRPGPRQTVALSAGALLTVLVLQLDGYTVIYRVAHTLYHTPENRTLALGVAGRMVEADGGKGMIGIARELRVSEADLRNLVLPYQLFAHKDLKQALTENTFVLVGHYQSQNGALRPEDDSLNALSNPILQTIQGNAMYRDNEYLASQTPHINPHIYILKGASYADVSKSLVPVSIYASAAGTDLVRNEKLPVQWLHFKKGTYTLTIKGSGVPLLDTYPHLKVWLGGQVLASYYLSPDNNEKRITFSISKSSLNRKVYIEYDNDQINATEDRNARVDEIRIIRHP